MSAAISVPPVPEVDNAAAAYAAEVRRRRFALGVAGVVLAVVVGFVVALPNPAAVPGAASLLIAVMMPVLLWRFPRAALWMTFMAACTFELGQMEFADSLTDLVPFFWNINTVFQTYGHINFKGVPLNLFEVLMIAAGVCSGLRSVYTHTTNVRGGVLLGPICLYLGFVALGWIVGMATGGDFKISLQEVRPQVYFGLAYLLAVNGLREPLSRERLLWIFAACVGLKGVLLTFRRYVTLAGTTLSDQGVGSHEEAFFFDAFAVLLVVLLLCRALPRLRRFMWYLLPFVQLGNLACNRRAATAAMVVVVPMLLAAAYRTLPQRRRSLTIGVLCTAAIFAVYFPAFRYKDGALAQPARAIQSSIAPDPRDASSNAYRDAENADLMATVHLAPLGYGYGKRMLHAVPIADISSSYEWWDIMTHNQILWVWMRVGTLGFIAFWVMVCAIIVQACLYVRRPDIDDTSRAIALFAMLVIGMLMIFGLLDLQLSNFRNMLFAGAWTGALAALIAAPRSKAAPPAPNFAGNGMDFPLREAVMPSSGTLAPDDEQFLFLSPAASYPSKPERHPQTAPEKHVGERRGTWDASQLGARTLPDTATAEPTPPAAEPDAPTLDAVSMDAAPAAPPSRVGRNVLSTLAAQLLSWGVTFAVTLVLPRAIGDKGLGEWFLAGSFAGLLSIVANMGTSTVLVRDIAREPAKAGEWAAAALAVRVPLGLVAVGLGAGAAHLLGYGNVQQAAILAALGVMVLGQAGDVFACVLNGLELIPRQNAAALLEKTITAVLTVWLALHYRVGDALWPLLAVGAWGTMASMGASLLALRGRLHLRLPSRDAMRSLVVASLPFLTMAAFMSVYGQADSLLLSKMSTTAAIGWYGLAKRLGGSTLVIPVALCAAMLPTLSRLYAHDAPAFLGSVARLFRLVLVGVVPFVAILVLAPGPILQVLNYPPSFSHAVPVLALMGGGVALWFLSQVAGTALVASDKQAALSRALGVSAVLCVPLCAGFIYVFERVAHNGAMGAMLSDVLLEAGMLAMYLRALPPGLIGRESVHTLGRALLAALPLVASFYFVHSKAQIGWLLPGLALYVPLCLVMKCLSPSDVNALKRVFRSKMAGGAKQ